MDKFQAAEDIRVIREVMERSARYTNFSGLSGVIAGLMALLGCGATVWVFYHIPEARQNWWYGVTWVAVLVVALAQDFLLSAMKSRRREDMVWTPATTRVVRAVLPGVAVAMILSIRALQLGELDAIPALWALGYGVACCAAGTFSVWEVRALGVLELITGAASLFYFSVLWNSLYVIAVAFGLYHIIFGLIMWRKYGW